MMRYMENGMATKLRVWWMQLWCKHHWHYVEQNMIGFCRLGMEYVWQCCWCERKRRTRVDILAGVYPPIHGRMQCWYNLYGLGRADIERIVDLRLGGLSREDSWDGERGL